MLEATFTTKIAIANNNVCDHLLTNEKLNDSFHGSRNR